MAGFDQDFADRLATRFGTAFSQSLALREQHDQGESWRRRPLPDAVLFTESTRAVADLMRL